MTITKNTKAPSKEDKEVKVVKETKTSKPEVKDAASEELKKVKITKPEVNEAAAEEEEGEPVVTLGKAQIVESMRTKVKEAGGALPPSIAVMALEALEATITEALQAGDEVRLGIGKFYVNFMEAREGRNPKTGEPVQIAESWAPKFKPSVTLKRAINEVEEEDTEEGEENEEGDDGEESDE